MSSNTTKQHNAVFDKSERISTKQIKKENKQEEIKPEPQKKPRKTYYVKKIKVPKPPKILKKRGRKAEPKKYEQNEINQKKC